MNAGRKVFYRCNDVKCQNHVAYELWWHCESVGKNGQFHQDDTIDAVQSVLELSEGKYTREEIDDNLTLGLEFNFEESNCVIDYDIIGFFCLLIDKKSINHQNILNKIYQKMKPFGTTNT